LGGESIYARKDEKFAEFEEQRGTYCVDFARR
jgi:hypothetical protein